MVDLLSCQLVMAAPALSLPSDPLSALDDGPECQPL
jgi:hypothetical protein